MVIPPERMAEVVRALYFDHTKVDVGSREDGSVLEVKKPFKMYISTHVGIVSDMFSTDTRYGDQEGL